MIWAVTIIALTLYSGAVTFALLRAQKRASLNQKDLLEAVTALGLERKFRKDERIALKRKIRAWQREASRLRALLDDVSSRVPKDSDSGDSGPSGAD